MQVAVCALSDVLAALQRVARPEGIASSAEQQKKQSVESLRAALQIVRFAALCAQTGIECIRSMQHSDVELFCTSLVVL